MKKTARRKSAFWNRRYLNTMTRIITVTSGKGGVGKTNLCANLCMHLASLGHKPCIFDADLGLANINIVLGLYPELTIEDVILYGRDLAEVIIQDHQGVDIIPGSSGVEKIANIAPDQLERLIGSFSLLEDYDFLFFDTSAGVSKNVVSFCLASNEVLLIITPEPTSLTDAYALLKILVLNGFNGRISVVVNQCKDTAIAKKTYTRFKEVVRKYLTLDIHPMGVIIDDPHVSEAVKNQHAYISCYPDAIASKCIRVIANNFLNQNDDSFANLTVESFFKRFIGHFTSSLKLRSTPAHETAAPSDTPDTPQTHAPAANHETGSAEDAATAAAGENPEHDEPAPVQQPGNDDQQPPNVRTAADIGADDNLFSAIAVTLTEMTDEMKKIRKALQTNGHAVERAHAQQDSASYEMHRKSIVLDFDNFVKGRIRG